MTRGRLYHVCDSTAMEFVGILVDDMHGIGRRTLASYLFIVLASNRPTADSQGFYEMNSKDYCELPTKAFHGPLRPGAHCTYSAATVETDELPTFLHWPHVRPDMARILAGTAPNDLPSVSAWRWITGIAGDFDRGRS